MILFQPNFLYLFPVIVDTKFIFCSFDVLKFKKVSLENRKHFWALGSFSSSKTTKVMALMATIDVNSSATRAFGVVSFKALAVHHAEQSASMLSSHRTFLQLDRMQTALRKSKLMIK